MEIVTLTKEYEEEVFKMMQVFYASAAVIHTASDKVLRRDIADCISDNPFIDGYVFLQDGKVAGYSMVAKSYTTEYGGLCVWVEDIYFKEEARGKGYATEFFHYLETAYPGAVRFKLEVENENISAIASYRKNGYAISEYHLMTKEMEED